jgi:pectinesterase
MLRSIHIAIFILSIFAINLAKAQTTPYPKSFTVALDGSGDYRTIQEAINAVRDLSQQQVTIHIKKGIYHEKLVVPQWKSNIYLLGDDPTETIITNSDYSGKIIPTGKDAFGKDKFSTYTSYTLLVEGNNFKANNLTIENASGRVGQAVALHVEADKCVFINCRLLGNQDTLYATNDTSRQLYQNCYIEGTTDFIFGAATAIFQNCTLKSLTNSYITAASTTVKQKFGYVFFNCKLIADSGINKVFLGRPWRPNARVVFINCEMGKHILPQGWNNWGNAANEQTVFYGEYNSKGEGAAIDNRAKWSKQLSKKELKDYTIKNIFSGSDYWEPAIQSQP